MDTEVPIGKLTMSFGTKSVAEVGEWLKREGFSDEVVKMFEGIAS